ncbi:MAG: hypothetical protein KGJ95_00980 [Candidatus Omnitrophica bacterium]|nr:hypothetical protein [Candidatus Omnitrophota bacterium]
MLRLTTVVLVLLTAVFMGPQARAQEQAATGPVLTVSGTVTALDIESGVLNVKTSDGIMVFYISMESKLYHFTHLMSSLEINMQDPVTIQYIDTNGRNDVVSLVDTHAQPPKMGW